MITWDIAQTTFQRLAHDNGTDALAFGKQQMNYWYKYILAELGRPLTEKTLTSTTVANQRNYQLPPEAQFVKSVSITVGSTKYTPFEEESQMNWDWLTEHTNYSDIPEFFFSKPNFGVGGAEILFEPIPSSTGNTITIVCEMGDKDLANDKYVTGTITLTNGSATVTGSGTIFTSAMVGRYLQVAPNASGDGQYYRIASKDSATQLTLENNYAGITTAGLTYQIVELFNLPEEMQMLPIHGALADYFAGKGNQKEEIKNRNLFDGGVITGKKRYATKTRSNIVRTNKSYSNGRGYPRHFPSSIT